MSDFDRVVAAYFEQIDKGVETDPVDFIAANPEHADELRIVFENLGVLDDLFGKVQRQNQRSVAPEQQIGDFLIVRELGRGGMGTVYEAEELSVGRMVALKVLHASAALDLERLTRFQNETRAAASLSHSNIVPMFSVGTLDGTHFFAMKLIDGSSLAEIIKTTDDGSRTTHPLAAQIGLSSATAALIAGPVRSSLSRRSGSTSPNSETRAGDRTVNYARICSLIEDVALALDHAHSRGVIHRDIKPSNLLIDTSGEVWVTDFGLARLEHEISLTRAGDILGTAQYMSPEQASGNLELDTRTDIYSLGVVLFQLLTGELPFRGKANVILHQIINDEPTSLRSLNASVHRDLETICLKCLQKKPHQRYHSGSELAEDLRRHSDGVPIKARPIGAIERTYKWCRRHKAMTAAIVLALFSVGLIVGVVERDARIQASANRTLQRTLESSELLREEAVNAKMIAQARSEELRLQSYSRDMTLAYLAYNKGWVGEVDRLLAAQVPAKVKGDSEPEVDHRGFEWYLLRRLNWRAAPVVMGGEQGAIHDVAVFAGGKRLATVGADSVIRIWNVDTRKIEFELCDDRLGSDDPRLWSSISAPDTAYTAGDASLALAISPDDKLLATGNLALTLWDLEQRERVRDVLFFPTRIDAIAFSNDGQQVAAHSRNELLKIAKLHEDRTESFSTGYGLYRFEFSPDSSLLAVPYKSSDTVKGLLCRDSESWAPVSDYPSEFVYRCPTFSSDGRFVFVGTYSDNIHLIDRESGDVVSTSPQQRSDITDLALSADDRILAATFRDGALIYWRLPTDWKSESKTALAGSYTTIIAHDGPAEAVRFVEEGRVVTCGHDGFLKLWEVVETKAVTSIDCAGELATVAIFLDGNGFWGASHDSVRYFDLDSKSCKRSIEVLKARGDATTGKKEVIFALARCSVSGHLAVGTNSGQIIVLDPNGEGVLHRFRQDDLRPGTINDMAFSPNGNWLANGSSDHTVRIRATDDYREIHRFATNGWASSVVFSPNGKRLAFADRAGAIVLVDVGSWEEIHRIDTTSGVLSECMKFSPDGKQLISGHLDSVIRVWDANTLTIIGKLKGHQRRIARLGVHPDGRTLVSASADESVRVWHLPTLSEIGIFDECTGMGQTATVFNADATKLIGLYFRKAVSEAGYRIWDLTSIESPTSPQ